ncbi:DsbA family oxidoreductase [Brevibacterium sp.]|uniref:DsbA family oxidoreductase n=1 Tax=Brevibacterium sp. TaxID=1701 RepID=UPI0025BC0F6B|nr:DsbA family oxidoreductase [Brevibacterium sp.]
MNIDIWSDIACPWCYIGKRRFEKALAAFPHRDEVTVAWHSFQLDPSLPAHYDGTEAQYLSTRKGMPEEQVRQMFAHVREQAAGEGLDYDFDSLVVANSVRGHQLLHLAKEQGLAGEVKEALLSAHFEHGTDIGDTEALVRIGVRAGLDEQTVRDELVSGSRIRAVEADIDEAAALGIRSVPTFVLDMTFAVSGAQPVEVFTAALDRAWQASHEDARK